MRVNVNVKVKANAFRFSHNKNKSEDTKVLTRPRTFLSPFHLRLAHFLSPVASLSPVFLSGPVRSSSCSNLTSTRPAPPRPGCLHPSTPPQHHALLLCETLFPYLFFFTPFKYPRFDSDILASSSFLTFHYFLSILISSTSHFFYEGKEAE